MNTIPNILTKKPIQSILNGMQTGEAEEFPVSQMDTVRNAITRHSIRFPLVKFATKTNKETGIITVTRTA